MLMPAPRYSLPMKLERSSNNRSKPGCGAHSDASSPFPTLILGEHVSDPVAQEFYFATILLSGLATRKTPWCPLSYRVRVDANATTEISIADGAPPGSGLPLSRECDE